MLDSAWTLNGTIDGSTTALLRGLAGPTTSAAAVTLFASSSGGLHSVADNAGYNAAPGTTALPAPWWCRGVQADKYLAIKQLTITNL